MERDRTLLLAEGPAVDEFGQIFLATYPLQPSERIALLQMGIA